MQLAFVFGLLAVFAGGTQRRHVGPNLFPLLMGERIQLQDLLTMAARPTGFARFPVGMPIDVLPTQLL